MSKAIYLNNKWNEVKNCQECKLIKYTDHPRPRYSCADGVSIGGCDIADGCRLPDWDTVRDHGSDEVPNCNRDVMVKIRNIEALANDIFIIGYYTNDKWHVSPKGNALPEYFEVISWRNIL